MLSRLDCGHNRLSSLDGVQGCVALAELWASHNRLPLRALLELRPLASLNRLVFSGNPCVKASPAGLYTHAAALLLPSLSSLDAAPLSRARAVAFVADREARAGLQAELGTKGALLCLSKGGGGGGLEFRD